MSWKKSNIFRIYKGGDPLNYQPIALLSVLSKVFTKKINNQMMGIIERDNIISIAQGGFQQEMYMPS